MQSLKRLVPDPVKAWIKGWNKIKPAPANPSGQISSCNCCGSTSILYTPILWDGLVEQWGLSGYEAEYINRQQGTRCKRCKVNLRAMAMAHGMMRADNYRGIFKDYVKTRQMSKKTILEINQAGNLTQYLQQIPGHSLAQYPEIDIQHLPYKDSIFDIVLHSDTLEHVAEPILALQECHRVLKPGGYCTFTVPIVVDRLTRTRDGLPPSWHGSPGQTGEDYLVHTEFGSDVWRYTIQAGFSEVRIYSLEYPAAHSLMCRK